MQNLKAGIFIAAFVAIISGAQAQAPDLRTPDGHPDFQGIWVARWITPLERPDGVSALIVPQQDASALEEKLFQRMVAVDPEAPTIGYDRLTLLQVNGEHRSSLIVDPADGKLPYTAEARIRRAATPAPSPPDGPEQRSLNERCIAGSNGRTPLLVGPAGNMRQVVQTTDTLVFLTEHMNDMRIVPLDGRTPPVDNLLGSSTGKWDGDTLVVETTGFRPGEGVRNTRISMFMQTPNTRVTERFSLLGANELLYAFTVEDPVLYMRPWRAEFVFRRSRERLFEYACHEGNYSLANILSGAREIERQAAAKAGKP